MVVVVVVGVRGVNAELNLGPISIIIPTIIWSD